MIRLLLATVLFVLGACSPSPKTPEGLLRMYVHDVTTKKLGKDYYLKHTAGELRSDVEALAEEELERRSYLANVSNTKVDIINENCRDQKCVLTYVVKYETKKGEKSTFEAETKKLAEFVKVDDEWKIASVTNLKTFFEAKEPISPME